MRKTSCDLLCLGCYSQGPFVCGIHDQITRTSRCGYDSRKWLWGGWRGVRALYGLRREIKAEGGCGKNPAGQTLGFFPPRGTMANANAMAHQVYMGIGSNVGNKKENFFEALSRLAKLPDTKIIKESS